MADNKYLLIKYEDNWADEIDIEGFRIMTEDDWKEYKKFIDWEFPFTFYVGTNEEIEYKNKEQLLKTFTKYKISAVTYTDMEEIFGTSYGHFPEY